MTFAHAWRESYGARLNARLETLDIDDVFFETNISRLSHQKFNVNIFEIS